MPQSWLSEVGAYRGPQVPHLLDYMVPLTPVFRYWAGPGAGEGEAREVIALGAKYNRGRAKLQS